MIADSVFFRAREFEEPNGSVPQVLLQVAGDLRTPYFERRAGALLSAARSVRMRRSQPLASLPRAFSGLTPGPIRPI
jgi:hypothetical protein